MPAVRSRSLSRVTATRLAVVASAAALALLLAACSGSSAPKSSASASPEASPLKSCATSGSESASVKVTGDFGTTPTVSLGSAEKATSTEKSVVIKGTGAKAHDGSIVRASLALYNASNAKTAAAYEPPANITVSASSVITGLAKILNCSQKGERLVGVVPPGEGFGSAGSSGLGIGAKDVMVFVVDVVDIVPLKASGTAQTPPPGLPTVKVASDGKPTLTIPSGYTAPATTQVATLIKGSGAVVAATDTVTIQYQGTNLRTGKIFDQTWGAAPFSGAVNGFVPGFTNAIVGQTVGSQILVVIAPADGYGPQGGQSSAGIAKDDTIIFVVDVLAAEPAAAG